jgi:CMP-N,N'-diacetyllegionaminic acid synthase
VKVLGIIPARGGSKGIPRKNIRALAGKSLLRRAFECGVTSAVLDRLIVSTDDIDIAAEAREIGAEVPFLRPAELATDSAAMIDVVLHALEALASNYRPDAVMLLQPTSPLRRPERVREAVEMMRCDPAIDSVCSLIPVPKGLCPHYVMRITPTGYVDYFLPEGANYVRRQDVPQAYKRDGSIFLTRSGILEAGRSFYGKRCMPMIIEPDEMINLDDPADWAEAEARLELTT